MAFSYLTPDEHFVTKYIQYASQRTDASLDYHEAAGYWLLSCVSSNVKGKLIFYPKGLPTNLYLMLVGMTTRDRKSTSINIAQDLLEAAIKDPCLPERLNPESLIEQMGKKKGCGAWCVDEMAGLFKSVNNKGYMADLREILMELYGGKPYQYARHSKRIKGGTKEDDADVISNPHLCILAATTPTIYQGLTQEDLESGLLPRFAVILPTERPARMGASASKAELESELAEKRLMLYGQLHGVAGTCANAQEVRFSEPARDILDAYEQTIETADEKDPDSQESFMRKRFPAMAIKLAMLTAIGDLDTFWHDGRMTVEEKHAAVGVNVARKWQHFAEQFASRVAESDFENKYGKFIGFLKQSKQVDRPVAARRMKMDSVVFNRVIDTGVQRGQVELVAKAGSKHLMLRWLAGEGGLTANGNGVESTV